VTEEDIEPLLHAVQAGPLEAQPWSGFVGLLRDALDANYANLIFRHRDSTIDDTVTVCDAENVEAERRLQSLYRAGFVGHDPIPYFTMQPGRIYTYDELEGVDALTSDPFREEFLRSADFEHLLIFRVTEPGGCNIWISVTRGAATRPFGDAARALCARLARAFVPALSCYSALLARSVEAQIYRRAADLLAFGVITLDGAGQVIALDEAARRRIDEVPELTVRDGRLRARRDDAGLQRVLAAARHGDSVEPIHLGDTDGLDLLIVPLARRADMGSRGVRTMVYLSARAPADRDVSAPLATLFGLSSTQARLAMLLSHGRTLAEAAGEIGITEQTARTYSKEIYLRTGTTRQGELIQRILTSVAMLS
jgi:DNA-binding CsgD family transcriptional regulator